MSNAKKMLLSAAGNLKKTVDITQVFSTFLYVGTGDEAQKTIVNGVDLEGEGGLVWTKSRTNTQSNTLGDSESGLQYYLHTNSTVGHTDAVTAYYNAFNNNGYTIGNSEATTNELNSLNQNFVSWTFRKAKQFFDIVTYTGNGVAGREIAHSLDSVPGMIIVKRTDDAQSWVVYHRGLNNGSSPEDYGIILNTTAGQSNQSLYWNDTAPTDTNFTLGSAGSVNGDGRTYVAYVFAHHNNDGEFGPDADKDVIKCGNYTGNGTDVRTIDLGFEAQWVLLKRSDGATDWWILDTMRDLRVRQDSSQYLEANTVNAEAASGQVFADNQGFMVDAGDYNSNGEKYIYMAIRRGPLFPPEAATEVFAMDINSSTNSTPIFTASFAPDFGFSGNSGTDRWYASSRLTGGHFLNFNSTAAQGGLSAGGLFYQNGMFNNSFNGYSGWMWKRAPSYFDCLAYSGNSATGRTISHSLGVAPEMMWLKSRTHTSNWEVYHSGIGATKYLELNSTVAEDASSARWNNTAPTSSVFTLGNDNADVNLSGRTYIIYLFASLAGVSKLGSVSHSNTTNVDCGFSNGARFVLLKRYDATGDWYIWDSVRGIIAGNDPYLLLNTTAAPVTNTDFIDPLNAGFTISDAFTDGDYIFYAIA